MSEKISTRIPKKPAATPSLEPYESPADQDTSSSTARRPSDVRMRDLAKLCGGGRIMRTVARRRWRRSRSSLLCSTRTDTSDNPAIKDCERRMAHLMEAEAATEGGMEVCGIFGRGD
jgi:hypothetical protein